MDQRERLSEPKRMILVWMLDLPVEMEAAALAEEYRLALDEHTHALALVKEMRNKVDTAQAEAEQARATALHYEREMERSAEQLTKAIQTLQVEDSQPLLPVVRDFVVEYNANIGCYHCYVCLSEEHALDAVDTSVLSVSVEHTKVSFSYASTAWWSVELERKVDAKNCSILVEVDHIYIRLPVNPSDKETVDGFSSFSQTAPHELQVDSYAELSCRKCGSALLDDTERIEKVLPLPSENWMEMFDFWGAGIGSFEHIPREGIFAHERRVYVGESHILLHEGDLKSQAVVDTVEHAPLKKATSSDEDQDSNDQDWVHVRCSACSTIVGDRRVESPITIRLQKHLLSAKSSGSTTGNVFDRYTIDSTVSAQMLHVAESDGIFRFVLRSASAANSNDEDESVEFQGLQLQLLSWDAKLQHSSSVGFHRVLKVIYSSGPGAALSDSLLAQGELPLMLRTHELLVPSAIGAEIASRLMKSSLLLPPSQRRFSKMTVGYLYA